MDGRARLAATFAFAAVAGACGSSTPRVATYETAYVATRPVTVRYVARDVDEGDLRRVERFNAETRLRMDRIAEDVRRDVADGDIDARALTEVQAQRARVEQALTAYGADGRLERAERRHVDQMVGTMASIKNHWEWSRARGGGPYYYYVP